jgi:hypothetical protein
MFDLRYHVASLAAVFLALIIGILVGVGISSGGFIKKSERSLLNRQIADLQGRLDAATRRGNDLARTQRAAQTFIKESYPALIAQRLKGKRIAVVFVGAADSRLRSLVERTLLDAGAPEPLRIRALKVPIDVPAVDAVLAKRPALNRYVGDRKLDELGQRLAQELVAGGDMSGWQALSGELLDLRAGTDKPPADAVVVLRTADPQRAGTARFLAGFYRGLAASNVPAVGAETTGARQSAVDVYAKAHLSSVDDLDTLAGRLALALLLGGGKPGQYGVKQSAKDGVVPPVETLALPAAASG